MKLQQIFQITLLAIFISGCHLTVSSRTTEENTSAIKSSKNQTAQDTGNPANGQTGVKKTAAQTKTSANAVCPDPEKPCSHREKEFAEWELSFKLPAKISANKTYRSAPFYAVILKTYNAEEDCDGGEFVEAVERDRKREQQNQLQRKVFAEYMCPNMDAVNYDYAGRRDAEGNLRAMEHLLAVYAGETKEEAEETLRFMKSEYPQAQLKQMTASWERIEQ